MTAQRRVAALQTEPRICETRLNVDDMLERGAQAVGEGADVLVYPELATSGYMFVDKDEALGAARDFIAEDCLARITAFCGEHDVLCIFGYPELGDHGSLYNSAMLVGPQGQVGNYRKIHLWNLENEIFSPGDLGYPVFDTDVGKIGILVCYDIWFPEAVRSLVLAGADLIALPTNWVPIEGAPHGSLVMANLLCQANSHINGMTIAAADRVGIERKQSFLGKSIITGPTGEISAGPASDSEPEILSATFDGERGRRQRRWNEYNDPVGNRRPATYITK